MTHYELLTVVASLLAQPNTNGGKEQKVQAELRTRIVGKLTDKGKF